MLTPDRRARRRREGLVVCIAVGLIERHSSIFVSVSTTPKRHEKVMRKVRSVKLLGFLAELCAAGYTGRKRGEVVRTRTVVSQAHS